MREEALRGFLSGCLQTLTESENETMTITALFHPGQVYLTPGVDEAIHACGDNPIQYLLRHVCGDWGELDLEDMAANASALHYGSRLLSAYTLSDTHTKIWIITEADRASSTMLLSEEY